MPSPEEITKALMEPFPATAYKPRPDNRALTYLEGVTIFRRLISATGNNFTTEVIHQEATPFGKTKNGGDRLLLRATVRLTIPELGSREHVGVQVVNAESGGEDLWKGAITDAIKKAATLFGVNLDNYGPDYESDDYDPGKPSVAAPEGAGSRRVPPPPTAGAQGQVHQPAATSRVPAPPTANGAPARGQRAPVLPDQAPAGGAPVTRRRVPPPPDEAGPYADSDGVLVPASDEQRNYLRGLYKGLGYVTDDGHTDMASLEGYLKRGYNATWETLTKEEAKNVITDLKAATEIGADVQI